MRQLRGDIFSVRGLTRSGTSFMDAYGKNKRKMMLTGVIAATYVVTTLGRFAPRIAKTVGKATNKMFKGKEQRVGRGVDVPEQSPGSVQEDAQRAETERKDVQEAKPVRSRKVNKIEKLIEKGGNIFKDDREDGLYVVEGNALRLLAQVVEACKKHNLESSSLKVQYELSPSNTGELLLKLEGKVIKVSEDGIYSMVGNPYYIHGKLDKNSGLNRLISDFSLRHINLLVSTVLAYEEDLFEIGEHDELFKKQVDIEDDMVVTETVEDEEGEKRELTEEEKEVKYRSLNFGGVQKEKDIG